MTPLNAILIVIMRLWAAGVIITSAGQVIYWAWWLLIVHADGDRFYMGYSGASSILWLLAGLAVWRFAPHLSRKIARAYDGQQIAFSIDAETFVAAGGFLIGAFYLVDAAPSVLTAFAKALADNGGRPLSVNAYRFDHILTVDFVTDLAVMLIAAWMVFRPKDLARLFSSLRKPAPQKTSGEDRHS